MQSDSLRADDHLSTVKYLFLKITFYELIMLWTYLF